MEELRKYPHHTRQDVPWWLCRFFCRDVQRAAVEAPVMETEERVRTFGRPEIIEQLDSLPLEIFSRSSSAGSWMRDIRTTPTS